MSAQMPQKIRTWLEGVAVISASVWKRSKCSAAKARYSITSSVIETALCVTLKNRGDR